MRILRAFRRPNVAWNLAAALLVVGQLSCDDVDHREPFVRVRTDEARLREATTIALAQVVDSSPLFFEAAGGRQGICGHYARVEVVEIVDGANVDSDVISNEPLMPGTEYLVALRDLTGRLPPVVDDPLLDESDRNYEQCRDQYTVYALGQARIVVIDGEEMVEIASANLIPEEVRAKASGGKVKLGKLLDAVVRIRAHYQGE